MDKASGSPVVQVSRIYQCNTTMTHNNACHTDQRNTRRGSQRGGRHEVCRGEGRPAGANPWVCCYQNVCVGHIHNIEYRWYDGIRRVVQATRHPKNPRGCRDSKRSLRLKNSTVQNRTPTDTGSASRGKLDGFRTSDPFKTRWGASDRSMP